MACSKDEPIEAKLTSIEYSDDHRSWTENYTYTPDGKLEKIENFRSLGRRYEMSYQNDRLQEILTYRIDNNELVFRDSLLYNTDGTIQSIHHFSTNAGEDVPISTIDEFEYDDELKVSKKSTYSVKADKYTAIEKYVWKRNNIKKVESFNEKEELLYEFFFEYDNKVNYKKGLPSALINNFSESSLFWNENNVKKFDLVDNTGLVDIICNPCKTDYEYNSNGYPVLIKSDSREMKLNYE